jgi:hypothetical protein
MPFDRNGREIGLVQARDPGGGELIVPANGRVAYETGPMASNCDMVGRVEIRELRAEPV